LQSISACLKAEIDCNYTLYGGDDPLAFVISCNLRRRHLTEAQRAWVASNVANLERGRPSLLENKNTSIDVFNGKESESAEALRISQSQAAQI
jgi:hypothetical protein